MWQLSRGRPLRFDNCHRDKFYMKFISFEVTSCTSLVSLPCLALFSLRANNTHSVTSWSSAFEGLLHRPVTNRTFMMDIYSSNSSELEIKGKLQGMVTLLGKLMRTVSGLDFHTLLLRDRNKLWNPIIQGFSWSLFVLLHYPSGDTSQSKLMVNRRNSKQVQAGELLLSQEGHF